MPKSTPERSAKPDKGLDILGQAKTSETKSGVQKPRPDARIQAHGARHFLDVSADLLTQISDHVGVGDFHGQEGV